MSILLESLLTNEQRADCAKPNFSAVLAACRAEDALEAAAKPTKHQAARDAIEAAIEAVDAADFDTLESADVRDQLVIALLGWDQVYAKVPA